MLKRSKSSKRKNDALTLLATSGTRINDHLLNSIKSAIDAKTFAKFHPELHDYGLLVDMGYTYYEHGSNGYTRGLARMHFNDTKLNNFLIIDQDLCNKYCVVVRNPLTKEVTAVFHGNDGRPEDLDACIDVVRGRSRMNTQITTQSEEVLGKILTRLEPEESLTLVGYSLGGAKVRYLSSTPMGNRINRCVYMNPFLSPHEKMTIPDSIKNDFYRISDDVLTLHSEFAHLNNNTTYIRIPPLAKNSTITASHYADQFMDTTGIRQAKDESISNVLEAELLNKKVDQIQTAIEMNYHDTFNDWVESNGGFVNSPDDVHIWKALTGDKSLSIEGKSKLAHDPSVFKQIASSSEDEAQSILEHFQSGEVSMEVERGLPYLQRMAMAGGVKVLKGIEYVGWVTQAAIVGYHLGNDYDHHANAWKYLSDINNDLNPYKDEINMYMSDIRYATLDGIVTQAFKYTFKRMKEIRRNNQNDEPVNVQNNNDFNFLPNDGKPYYYQPDYTIKKPEPVDTDLVILQNMIWDNHNYFESSSDTSLPAYHEKGLSV